MFNQTNQCLLVLFEGCNTQKSKTGQDAYAWGTEGLTLTKCIFCQKQRVICLDILVVESMKFSFC